MHQVKKLNRMSHLAMLQNKSGGLFGDPLHSRNHEGAGPLPLLVAIQPTKLDASLLFLAPAQVFTKQITCLKAK